jgi:hypothetical protein
MGLRKDGMTSSKTIKNSNYALEMEKIAKAKHEHRVELARLPFPEKVKIVIELQKIHNGLAKAAGRKPIKVWKI